MTGAIRLAPGEALVAVATSGSGLIDRHFGQVEDFAIYAVGPRGIRGAGVRSAARYCQGGYGDEDKRAILLRALSDCAAVFVARVGDGPRARLTAAGIEPVDDYPDAPIEAAIGNWYRGRGAPRGS